jgi:integrase
MKTPKYSLQKGHGIQDRAFVKLNNKKHYLGTYASPESWEKYNAILSEYYANGGTIYQKSNDYTIAELCCSFNDHAKIYYRRQDGTKTSEVNTFKLLCTLICELYGRLPVEQFSPIKLEAVRATMIKRGWARKNINNQISRVRTIIKFGVRKELVHVTILEALKTVDGLAIGRTTAKETEKIKPVPKAHIDAIEPLMSSPLWAMIQLQLHTAARPGEICLMRLCDIDMTQDIWIYKPHQHKTLHHGMERYIYIGPQAQEIINQFSTNQPFEYLFSPKATINEINTTASTHRRKDQIKNINITGRTIGDCYTSCSYRRAIARACKTMKIPSWAPNRLRHNAATFIRKTYGLEAAQIILGHSKADVTQIYAEINEEKAIQIMREIG